MAKLRLKLTIVVLLLAVVSISEAGPKAGAVAGPEPGAGPEPEAAAKPDIIPGRIQNNPILLIYDLIASLIATILIIGIFLVQLLGLGR